MAPAPARLRSHFDPGGRAGLAATSEAETAASAQAAGFGGALSAESLSCVLKSKSLASWRSGN
jgi:hypothetical protein